MPTINSEVHNLTLLFRQFNYYLKVMKRIAYECPLTHISDTFFVVFYQYKVESRL